MLQSMLADAEIPVTGKKPRWYVYGQGGGWLGSFSLPIWQHIMANEKHPDGYSTTPDEVAGTSVSSLHAALAAQGDLDRAEDLWLSMDDSFSLDGIKGFTKLSLKAGIWSMKPLKEKIDRLIHLNRIKIPCRVGVVTRSPARHYSLAHSEAKSDKQWRKWIAASTAIAVVFQPVRCNIRGESVLAFDGGHLFSVPWIPYQLRPGDRVDFILHNPLDANATDVPKMGKNKLLSNLKWALWIHTKTGHWEVLRRAKTLLAQGVDVRLWAPSRPLGDMLDASAKTALKRRELGLIAVDAGPTSSIP